MTTRQIQNERLDFVNAEERKLFKLIARAQRDFFNDLLKLVFDFRVDDEGKLTFSTYNITQQKKVRKLVDAFNGSFGKEIVERIIKGVSRLITFNKKYFDTQSEKRIVKKAAKSAENKVYLNIGWDHDKKIPIKNSWLDQVANDNKIAGQIVREFNKGISGKQDRATFVKNFENKFFGKTNGIVEARFKQQTNDVFATYDRTVQLEIADQLGYNYFIWAHTVKDTSTDFCRDRSNNIYTREFAERWDQDLDWQGKKDGNDIFIDGHGYNCRSTINWISDGVAETLIKRGRTLNEYN